MKLIDADELKKAFDNPAYYLCNECPEKQAYCFNDCLEPDSLTDGMRRVIDMMPTVDQALSGRWVLGKFLKSKTRRLKCADIVYCDQCHNEAYWDTDYGQQLFRFCPYCGADMNKEDTSDET